MGITQKINGISFNLKEAKIALKNEIEDNWDEFVETFKKDPKKFIEARGLQMENKIPDEIEIELVEDSKTKIYLNVEPKNTHPEFY